MEDAALWVKANDITRRDASVVAEEFADELSQMSGRCIDIGPGPGDVLVDFILPKMSPDVTVVGVDVSEGMISYAKEKYKDNRSLSFVRLDIETADLPKELVGKFDHATSFYCLHWCLDQRQAMENIFNMLRPGGTVILTSLASVDWWKALGEVAAMPRYQQYHEGDRYLSIFLHPERTRETMKNLAEGVGFEVRHCSIRDRIFVYERLDIFRDLVLAVNPFMRKIPLQIRDDYIKDVIEAALKYLFVPNKNDDNKGGSRAIHPYSSFVVYLKKRLPE